MSVLRQSHFGLYSRCNRVLAGTCTFSTLPSKDLFEALEEKVEEDIGFDQWLASTKEGLKNTKGRYWLGKSTVLQYFQQNNFLIFSLFRTILHLYPNQFLMIHQSQEYSSFSKIIQN